MDADEDLSGERKQVTIFFADIADSTTLVGDRDPEEANELLAPTVRLMIDAVEDHGGTIARRLGDGMMALFGAPIALEDHAARAASAALALQESIRLRAEGAAHGADADVKVRVGINTGEIVVQPPRGDGLAKGIDVAGFAVHLAARLEALAPVGSVYVSESTFRATRDRFDIEPLGLRTVKGVDEPLPLFELVGKRSGPPLGLLQKWGINAPFVGRSGELRTIVDALARLSEGTGGIIAILGEAGVGKTRLLAEAKASGPGAQVSWLEGAAVSFGRSLSYLPLLQMIRDYLGVDEVDDGAALWDRMAKAVGALFPQETDEVLPYLATLLGIEVPDALRSRVGYLDSDAMGRQVRRSVRLLFQRIAQSRPTILVFEDFYWFDESSAALVTHLLPLTETEPLLICFLSRGEAHAPEANLRAAASAQHSTRYVEMTIKPFADADSRTLIDGMLEEIDGALAQLRDLILDKAEGNPLYIEEVLRTLLETGQLRHDGKWRLVAEIQEIQIPNSIQDVVTARIDRLEADAKRVLTVASVIGRQFFYEVLSAIVEASETLDDQLSKLVRLEFIDKHRISPDLEYMFRHAMIQEATYGSILRRRRRMLHRHVGEILEARFAGRGKDISGVLAYHFAQAEMWEKAQGYLFKAGDQCDRLAADSEALHHYQMAVDAYQRAFGDRLDEGQRALVERKIGEAYFRRGDSEMAFRHL